MEFSNTDPKPLFVHGPSPGVRLVLLVLLSLTLMVLDLRGQHVEKLRDGLAVLMHPVRAGVDLPISAAQWLYGSLKERQSLLHENETLRGERLLTEVRLQRVAALEAENARLRALMDSTAHVADRVLVGEILAVDLDPTRHRVVVNKGLRDGVFQGQPLLDAHGIVGQITRAQPLGSEAILISDPGHAVPVEVNRTGLRTIAVGGGEVGRLSLPFLPNNADVEAGDLLVTSGLGQVFPAGYPVAVIASVQRNPHERFALVAATPSASLDRVREVLLVWSGEMDPDDLRKRRLEQARIAASAGDGTPAGQAP